MSRDVISEIREEVKSNKILLYMKGTPDLPRCGFSNAIVEILKQIGQPFHGVDVLSDQEKWSAVKTFSSWPTIPQLYINGEFIGGCDIAREMHAKGELKSKIEAAPSGTD